jgi:hypothetical protein
MATLPATGAALSFGQINRSFTNIAPNTAGDAPSGGQNIKLSSVLGNRATYTIGQTVGTTISLSTTFGGKTTPYS